MESLSYTVRANREGLRHLPLLRQSSRDNWFPPVLSENTLSLKPLKQGSEGEIRVWGEKEASARALTLSITRKQLTFDHYRNAGKHYLSIPQAMHSNCPEAGP